MNELKQLLQKWETITSDVLDLKPITPEEIQTLLKETYLLLTKYHESEVVPKTLVNVLLEMTDFVNLADMMEQHEVENDFYCAFSACVIVTAIQRGFLNGKFACSYPELALKAVNNETIIFNLETDDIKKLHL